jgi:shikimate dehydrogenase
LDDKELRQRLSRADLLVNTTSIGLHGESFSMDMLEHLATDAMVYDMVYRRGTTTPLVQNAMLSGRKAAAGLGMLAAQGEEAFRLWIGSPPPTGLMKNCLLAECLEK